MEVLLTHGYFLAEDPLEAKVMRPYPPLGLLYLASHLKAKGFDVEVFDSTFSTRREFQELLDRERPPVVGIYGNLMTRGNVLDMTRRARAAGARVVLGGPEPASYASQYLRRGADVVVEGEGEVTLEELVPRLLQPQGREESVLEEVPGIHFLTARGELRATAPRAQIQDLDAQPFPDREAIDLNRYLEVWRRHHGRGAVSLITARGCPFECKWCSHGVYGFTHRRRSPQNVADEVEHIRDRYRPDLLWYADDVFTIHHGWLFEYAREIQRRGLEIPFETISREDRLNEKVIATLAQMGCWRLWIGAESGSQRVLDAMKRRTNAQRMREMVRLLQRHGIEAGSFIMLGYDGETVEDIEATVEHLKAAIPDQFLTTVAYPIEGTAYAREVSSRTVSLKDWDAGSDRDRTVAGRHSRRFYRHAIRWMVNEVAWARQRQGPGGNYLRLAKTFLNARLGRLGMAWTRAEVEAGGR